MHQPHSRSGFALIDLTVLAGIVGISLSLAMVAVPRTRAKSQLTECTNNLKQMGLAFKSYHDNDKCLPTEKTPNRYFWLTATRHGCTSFYCDLLPYVEEKEQFKLLMGDRATPGDLSKAKPVKLFLCPDRHTVTKGTKRAFRDFGCRQSGDTLNSVLDAPLPVPYTTIANLNGLSHTALITHYWWDADQYSNKVRTNLTDGWSNAGHGGKTRAIDQFDSDFNQLDSKPLPKGTQTGMGSPHATGNPTLFADGSVHIIPYDPNFAGVKHFFYYDNMVNYKIP